MDAKSCEKLQKDFVCKQCNYSTNRKSSIDKHKLSSKHQNRQIKNVIEQKTCDKELYACGKCQKTYTARNSLWYHSKKCNNIILENELLNHYTTVIHLTSLTFCNYTLQ